MTKSPRGESVPQKLRQRVGGASLGDTVLGVQGGKQYLLPGTEVRSKPKF